jgi:hypothetical protein
MHAHNKKEQQALIVQAPIRVSEENSSKGTFREQQQQIKFNQCVLLYFGHTLFHLTKGPSSATCVNRPKPPPGKNADQK